MAWTAPRTYVAGEVLTAAILNTDHRDNLVFLGADRIAHQDITVSSTADADNTASEITVLTATVTPAIADGESLELDYHASFLNNSAATRTTTIDAEYGGVKAEIASSTSTNGSVEEDLNLRLTWLRAGADMSVVAPIGTQSTAGLREANVGATLTGPTFTASQTLKVYVQHSAAHASLYWRSQSARLRYLGSAT